MHEGELFDNDDVRLNDPLDIPGYEHAEFPGRPPVVASAIDGLVVGPDFFGDRPRPEIVAYGLTSHSNTPRRFPMVGVYDGEPVEVGRIVVDSTWHHWFSMNLVGLRKLSPRLLRGDAALLPQHRLVARHARPTGGNVVRGDVGGARRQPPGRVRSGHGMRGLGERVVDVIGRTAPQCILDEFVATVAMLPRRAPGEDSESRVGRGHPHARRSMCRSSAESRVDHLAKRTCTSMNEHVDEKRSSTLTPSVG